MIGRIVEIAQDARHVALHRGFLVIKATTEPRQELGRIALDEISAVIANAHGLSYTNNALVALAQRGIPFVLCGSNHNAVGLLLGIDGHHAQAKRFDAQIASGKPLNKRLWAMVVKQKIACQAAILELTGANPLPLQAMVKKVQSGDPSNMEAQAARLYWQKLMGRDFRRNRKAEDINALLNYGYTVLRAATARSVMATGLHPTLGIHHQNEGNAMRLVDDMMEPFRPLIDLRVWQLQQQQCSEINVQSKKALVNCLYQDLNTVAGTSPILVCIHKLCNSLAMIYLGEEKKLEFPQLMLPKELQQFILAEQ